MPRRHFEEAQTLHIRNHLSRLSFLVRNPTFRNDLHEFSQKYEPQKGFWDDEQYLLYKTFMRRWGLVWFPQNLVGLPITLRSASTDELGDAIYRAMKQNLQLTRREVGYLFRPAVVAEDPAEKYFQSTGGDLHSTLDRGEVLDLRIDLSYPIDVLVVLIESEIKRVISGKKNLREAIHRKNGHPPPKSSRQRMDKIGFYLRVYDQTETGKSFSEVARTLKRPLSTVKSAFLRISKEILGLRPMDKDSGEGGRKDPPITRKKTILARFEPESHLMECTTCKEAKTFEDMCAKAQHYALQDYSSLRERLDV